MKKLIDDNELQDNTVEKKSYTGIIITVILLCVVLFGCISVAVAVKRFTSTTVSSAERKHKEMVEQVITIEQGSSVANIASTLSKAGIIDSEAQFIYLCKREGRGSSFQPGEYTFNNYMDFYDICNTLESGYVKQEFVTITIREGMWAKEIAKYLEEQGLCTYDEFMEAANSRDYDYDFVQQIPERDILLEGYLFPDTYNVTVGTDAKGIVNKLLARFDEIYSGEMRMQTTVQGKTIDEIVTVASVIEAEVRYPDERRLVASVIYNRIAKGMKLQMDATVLYSLGERKERVLFADLENPEAHNTYYVSGLPVGPVGNPGAACIEAALDPADTDYLYYVLKDTESGEHVFFNNSNDFDAAANAYRSQLD